MRDIARLLFNCQGSIDSILTESILNLHIIFSRGGRACPFNQTEACC